MQALAAYYVIVANETARAAQRPYLSTTPKPVRRTRFAAAIASFVRPARRALASAV